jgi:hypothetical protein
MNEQTDFETSTVTVERKGKTRTFVVTEASYGFLQDLGASMTHQDDAQRKVAVAAFGANLIAATCSENGESLSFEQAKALPGGIGKRLEKEAMQINGMSEEAQADAKNA